MIQVKVGTLDMYGFCGRENHPLKTDAGKVGTLISSERFEVPGEDEDGNETLSMLNALTVEFEDGRKVELIAECEVESIKVINE